MSSDNTPAPVPETPKRRFNLSIPRTVVTHVASFLAGAATYAGAQKLGEKDVQVQVDGETVIGD